MQTTSEPVAIRMETRVRTTTEGEVVRSISISGRYGSQIVNFLMVMAALVLGPAAWLVGSTLMAAATRVAVPFLGQ